MSTELIDLSEYTPEEQYEAHKLALQGIFRKSLYRTAKYLLGYEDVNLHTHGSTIASLESQTKRKLVVMPRGTFKSTLVSVAYPIWLLIRDPNLRILLDSEIYSNSKNFIRQIRAHMEDELITEVFGQFKTDTWNEGEVTIAQRKVPFKEASITAGGVGTVKVGQHYDVIIGDDMNSKKNSDTPEGAAKVVTHYQMNQAILEPQGIYAIVGTRYSAADVIGHVIENEIDPERDEIHGELPKN
jgi:hypothetical protein